MNNILITIDSFKNSISSKEAIVCLKKGLKDNANFNIETQTISDGGEGSLEVIFDNKEYIKEQVLVANPLGKQISSAYAININEGIAFIEMAKSSGLELLNEDELNPLYTSTYGVGQIILDAYKKGIRDFVISIGGSATNDGGAGMLSALGVEFVGANKKEISNNDLNRIKSIISTNIKIEGCKFKVLSDVDNPLLGENGATYIYAKQKGAKENELLLLENNLKHYANILEKHTSENIKLEKGTGAAGGVAFGLKSFFDVEIVSGISELIKMTSLENKIKNADIVITGEGTIDKQTLNGKVVDGITNLCKIHNKPFILVAGIIDNETACFYKKNGCIAEYQLIDRALNKKDSIKRTNEFLEDIGKQIAIDLASLMI